MAKTEDSFIWIQIWYCYLSRLGASTGQKYSSTSTWKNDEYKYKYKYWIFKSTQVQVQVHEKMTSTSTSTSTGFSKVLKYKYKYFEKYLSTNTEYFRCKLQ